MLACDISHDYPSLIVRTGQTIKLKKGRVGRGKDGKERGRERGREGGREGKCERLNGQKEEERVRHSQWYLYIKIKIIILS